jgi:hypothetical protein
LSRYSSTGNEEMNDIVWLPDGRVVYSRGNQNLCRCLQLWIVRLTSHRRTSGEDKASYELAEFLRQQRRHNPRRQEVGIPRIFGEWCLS